MSPYLEAPPQARAAGIDALWPGSRVEGPHGVHHARDSVYGPEFHYGTAVPAALLHVYRQAPPLIAGDDAAALTFADALFLDTETTGLSGGTGTYVFLIGAARFIGGELVLRQFFLPELHGERALLQALEEFAAGCTGLVTFNGKCFDVPLLANRHIMQRSRMRLPTNCHLDLLWPARRLWSRRLPSCALSALERDVLGVYREGDVPGALIPELYFRYLRQKDAAPLTPVFEHNRRDVVALAALAAILCGAATEPVEWIHHPVDLLALGRLFARQRDDGQAERCYRQALAGRLPRAERGWAWVGLAEVCERTGRREEAMTMLHAAARQGGPAGLDAAVRLAKRLEHQARDYAAAAEVTALALSQQTESRRTRAELDQRLARLRRKQAAVSAPSAAPPPSP